MTIIKMFVFSIFILMTIFPANISVNAQSILVDNNIVEPFANAIEWRYKIINGVLHRRLLNVSTDTWIGVWEPV
ncbi:hypothetical protein GIY11_10425 [Aerococcaceae bacterium DSM 109653]|uniref:Uncharacterized protein n=1 Tax=Fundicoccus ignavus TaxID=2664442 RepID=A0A844BMR6_9LACT|nr:hypothetical protein [Fundicoccus ignavus]MRI82424.1 hypothetical protein [Fundicoccus ignavus]